METPEHRDHLVIGVQQDSKDHPALLDRLVHLVVLLEVRWALLVPLVHLGHLAPEVLWETTNV